MAIPPRTQQAAAGTLFKEKKERFACLSKLRQTNRPFFFAKMIKFLHISEKSSTFATEFGGVNLRMAV
jgi:hypothetical protein